ncbi:unnamed protein product [Parnassius apollo]|uniref:(apollo) hypothetical protein n=1 Tax=Parnassius apollo TaxID=110799 RepID=A0A8S3W928_PARAO|nr:unnamed protein product [Parnassius apollo]
MIACFPKACNPYEQTLSTVNLHLTTKSWTTLNQIMLSVQVPGCAGMERLGAPGGPRLRHDHRHHSTLEWEKQQRLQAMVGRLQEMVEQETRARSAAAAERLGLPPSIRLPDGEYGQDAHLQLRVPYQQAELTRSSFQPPPNKCVSDVPEWAGAAEAGPARRAGAKKDGLLQKATRWWVRMGARPPAPFPAAPPPCVMVPRRPPPPLPPLPPLPPVAARRVTPPPRITPLPYHAYIPLSGRSHSPKCTRVPEYYRLANLFIWDSRPRRVTRTRTL